MASDVGKILVVGGFDDLRIRHVRLLHESSRLGEVTVLLWSDEVVRAFTGARPKFSLAERQYLVGSLRFVREVVVIEHVGGPWWRRGVQPPGIRSVCFAHGGPAEESMAARAAAAVCHADCRAFADSELEGFTGAEVLAPEPAKRKVVVSGCFDWLHSGHVRFFEEAAAFGELYVVVGHDANIRLLKGPGHPRFTQEQRRYMVESVRHVHKALTSSGTGWLDAEPEIEKVGAQMYVVNEDGDRPEKREFCEAHGIDYVVLKREPAAGLPRRTSTDLRGF
jgi:cytidyltransferase-like protein